MSGGFRRSKHSVQQIADRGFDLRSFDESNSPAAAASMEQHPRQQEIAAANSR